MTDTTTRDADARERSGSAAMDERRIARGIGIGLPLVTVTLATVTGPFLGAPIAILILAAGTLLGVIALFWGSLRVLSGDAPLPPEIEALDRSGHAVDALASRKKMLLRALKDLDNEHALGKLDDEDYHAVAETYRTELKDVLRRIDASLEPFRGRAEETARTYLVMEGLVEGGYRGAPAARREPAESDPDASNPSEGKVVSQRLSSEAIRVTCTTCNESNEPDAKFCKGCGERLDATTKIGAMVASTVTEDSKK